MHPLLFGTYPTGMVLWGVALGIWVVVGAALGSRDGYGRGRTATAMICLAVFFLAGAKVHYWLANHALIGAEGVGRYLMRGFHLPGGVLAGAVLAPFALRALGLPVLAFGDACVPAAGFALAVVRLGCFFNGCCAGRPTEAPWGIAFPRGSLVHATHLLRGYIPPDAPFSLPVVPLMLIFGTVALCLSIGIIVSRRWQSFPGQMGLTFLALWSMATVVLEPWRDPATIAGTPRLGAASALVTAGAIVGLLVLSRRHRRELSAMPPGRPTRAPA